MYVASTKRLTLAGARKMMASAMAQAEQAGIAISVAIVDAGGHLIMFERPDTVISAVREVWTELAHAH